MSKNPPYYHLVPEKILSHLSEFENSIEFQNISGYRRAYLLQIISVIACNTHKDGGATALMTSIIRKEVPQGYEYLRALIGTGLIERLGRYVPGQNSYKYRFSETFNSRFIRIPVTDAKLLYRLSKKKPVRGKTSKYSGQNKFIRKLKIDDQALSFIEDIEDTRRYNASLASVLRIINGNIHYSVDSTSGRYHSNLTNLSKNLRKFITIEGKQLANIDLKNSQPYLSTLLLNDPGKTAPFAKDENFAMFLKSLQPIDTEDSKMFVKLVVSGQIYEYLIQEFAKYDLHYTRSQVKKKIFIILFARNSIGSKQRRIFAKLFPNVHARFSEVRGSIYSKNRFENSKRFAILLQAVESHLILGRILPRIYDEYPGTIAVSIHDSVCTSILTSDIEIVKRIMEDELEKFVTLKPSLQLDLSISNIDNREKIKGKEEERGVGIREVGIRRDQYVSKTFVKSRELVS